MKKMMTGLMIAAAVTVFGMSVVSAEEVEVQGVKFEIPSEISDLVTVRTEGLEQDIFATELMLGAESQPISGKLYCFSVEVEDISCMAEVFFDGVTSISGGAFEITDIEKEAVTPEMEESGVYQQKISYRVNGTKYEYDASIQYDWFDVGVISALNEALASERLDKRLFGDCSSDIMMISYCTKEWAEEFNEKTGFDLH